MARHDLALAYTAGPVAAAIGKEQALGQGRGENGVFTAGFEMEAAGLEGDLERHDGWP